MPIYEYRCPKCGSLYEIRRVSFNQTEEINCLLCSTLCKRVLSKIGFFRIHHTEKLDYNDPLRVYDRQKMVQDSAVKKAVKEYADEQRELPNSPFKGR